MQKASKVMYSIANFFTWILVILSIVGIVLSVLMMVNVIPLPEGDGAQYIGIPMIVYLSIILIVGIITISMVRRAKKDGTSKAWDVFFIIVGVLGGNIFYILGGIFGLFEQK